MHVAQGLTAQVTMECGVHKNIYLHTLHSVAHSTPSLMIPPSLSISSLITCTPIWIPSSDEIYCDGPINVSFGSLADLHSPARSALRGLLQCHCLDQENSWRVEHGDSDAETSFLDGNLGAKPSFLRDGDQDAADASRQCSSRQKIRRTRAVAKD